MNGTLEPLATTAPGPPYRALMLKLLMESDIHPHGYGDECPDLVANQPHAPYDFTNFNIFSDEVATLLSMLSENHKIKHYIISVPIFFTHSNQEQLIAALKRSGLPTPSLGPNSADHAASAALNTTRCPRHSYSTVLPYTRPPSRPSYVSNTATPR